MLYRGEHYEHHDIDDGPSTVQCKRCGEGGLHWVDDDGACVLVKGKYEIHKCDPQRLQKRAMDDFEDVS